MQDFKPDGLSLSSNLGTHILEGGDPLFSNFHMWLRHTRSKIEACEEEEEGPTHPYLQLPSSPTMKSTPSRT